VCKELASPVFVPVALSEQNLFPSQRNSMTNEKASELLFGFSRRVKGSQETGTQISFLRAISVIAIAKQESA